MMRRLTPYTDSPEVDANPWRVPHVKIRHLVLYLALMLGTSYIHFANAQTRKPLTNQDSSI
jgi:hypothetical protein